jgi:iron complex outermembrane recepter protein
MLNKIQYLFLALSLFSAFISASAKAEVKQGGDSRINYISRISQLSQFPKPATTIKEWFSQSPVPSSSQILVTGVRINQTKEGIEVILDTLDAGKLQPTSRSEGNSLIVDIPNAQLRDSAQNTFRQEKPIAGITEVSVINTDATSIR